MRLPSLPLVLAALLLAVPAVASLAPTALWPDGPGHSHGDAAQHAGFGQGLQQLAQRKIRDGSVGEVDALGDLAVVAHFGAAGLTTVDVGDPANPVVLGAYLHGTGGGMDVKLVPGTTLAILGVQGGTCSPPAGFVSTPRPTGCGLNVIDLANPAAPAFASAVPCGDSGVHMLDVEVIAGVPFAFAVCQGEAFYVAVFAIVPAARTLAFVGIMTTQDTAQYVHDVTVRPDPDGHTYAYVAAWNQGVWVFDVTIPALPVPLGAWTSASASNLHTVMPAYVEGKRLLVVAPEYRNTVHVLDASDPLNIVKVGEWRFPDLKPEGSTTWSTHDFNVQDGKVYLAHYHGGVQVLGLRTLAEAASPPLLAWLLPAGTKYTTSSAPLTWDAVPHNGAVLLGDMTLGFVTARETA